MRGIVTQFIEHKLVPGDGMARFRNAILNAMAWRNSITAEVALAATVPPLGYYLRSDVFALQTSTWYATVGPHGGTLTVSGWWFFWVSNPILPFLLLRLLFRLAIWGRFLWQVSRGKLALIIQLLWATLSPFTLLVFTRIPLEQLLDRILKAVF